MVIYLAGLQSVSQTLYDAAKVDGATVWQRLHHITIPLISPTTFFLLIIQMLGAFQLFVEPFVLTTNTQGDIQKASVSMVIYIYQNAFDFQRMGKASAIAWPSPPARIRSSPIGWLTPPPFPAATACVTLKPTAAGWL